MIASPTAQRAVGWVCVWAWAWGVDVGCGVWGVRDLRRGGGSGSTLAPSPVISADEYRVALALVTPALRAQ